jgi:hypothetical protein
VVAAPLTLEAIVSNDIYEAVLGDNDKMLAPCQIHHEIRIPLRLVETINLVCDF